MVLTINNIISKDVDMKKRIRLLTINLFSLVKSSCRFEQNCLLMQKFIQR